MALILLTLAWPVCALAVLAIVCYLCPTETERTQ
jgi:hypothetical protein